MRFTRPSILGFLFSLLIFLTTAEVFCRLASHTGFWYHHFDFTGDLTSLPEVEDRLRWGSRQSHPVFLLGDSVLGPTALMEQRIPDPRSKSLAFYLRKTINGGKDLDSGKTPPVLVSLGADGLLLPDLEALASRFGKNRPERVVLVLNFRMFAPEFEEGPAPFSRTFLQQAPPALGKPWWERLHEEPGERIESWALGHWSLLKTTRLLKTLWYAPSQKDVFQGKLEPFLPARGDGDLRQAALRMKIAPYYPSQTWNPDGAPMKSLEGILKGLSDRKIPVLVVLSPQNPAFLGENFNLDFFQRNRRQLGKFMAGPRGAGASYLDWASRFPEKFFLDHCHLTPEGNQKLAGELLAALGGKP